MNTYVLYVNHIASGDVECINQYSSFTEASKHIEEKVMKLLNVEQDELMVLDRNCTVDNALKTIGKQKYIIKSTPMRTDIYSKCQAKGYLYSTYIAKLEYTIAIMEVIQMIPIPTPPPPPQFDNSVDRIFNHNIKITTNRKHMNNIIGEEMTKDYVNELKVAVDEYNLRKKCG